MVAHHVEGTLGQVVVLASKDFLGKVIIATISWIDYNSSFIPFPHLTLFIPFSHLEPGDGLGNGDELARVVGEDLGDLGFEA